MFKNRFLLIASLFSYPLIGDNMLDRVKNYIIDSEFRLTLYIDMIHIINYTKIISLEETKIIIRSLTKRVVITGEKLHLSRLLEEEILIKGNIKNIEVENV